MAILKTISSPKWALENYSEEVHTRNLRRRFLAFADTQKDNRTLWFIVSLIFQGVVLLPVPAVLMFYYDAPITVLAVSPNLFFYNNYC